jgi:hypothetical protein
MYIGIHKPKLLPGGDNKGSSSNLIEYLEKEDGDIPSGFYNQENDTIMPGEAQRLIDDNSKGLEKKDTKFFMLSINPGQWELNHLLRDIVPNQKINHISQLTPEQRTAYYSKIKEYTKEVMNLYAEQFDREVNGRKLTGDDLVYVAKIEEERKWSGKDVIIKENRTILRYAKQAAEEGDNERARRWEDKLYRDSSGNIIQSGDLKDGLQTHIHIVVSRFDKSKSTKLSPLANSRGYSDKHQVGGRQVKVGFSRLEFSLNCGIKFTEMFPYHRHDHDKEIYKVQMKRNSKGNITSTIDKYGQIDPLNAMRFAYYTGENIVKGKVPINLKSFSPQTLAEMFVNQVNPIYQFKAQLNLKTAVKKQIIKAITGSEL